MAGEGDAANMAETAAPRTKGRIDSSMLQFLVNACSDSFGECMTAQNIGMFQDLQTENAMNREADAWPQGSPQSDGKATKSLRAKR